MNSLERLASDHLSLASDYLSLRELLFTFTNKILSLNILDNNCFSDYYDSVI